ncbi:MAG: universal stress protein [Chromatiaceae bacterium]|jgi:nucleotide-binding universal stress UspA family protein|nr:universal stress protein [Chromatiaceae bacterium]
MADKQDLPDTPVTANGDTDPPRGSAGEAPGSSAPVQSVHVADDSSALAKAVKATRKKSSGGLILVPVDFSAHSEAALVFAAKLAECLPAKLVVLHVVHDPGEMPGYYSKLVKKKRIDRIPDIAKDVFDDFMKDVVREHQDLKAIRKAENLMVIGLPVTRILQVTEKLEPILVVMGSQGRTGLKHLFLGSKAEQVVQLCPAPVTIVKQKK